MVPDGMKSFRFADLGLRWCCKSKKSLSRTWRGKKHLISHFTEAGRQEA